ncbi:hypothetical protein DFH29DRAFT_477987 [Suillus ampliporus]|nr:hypothetical protein DFH29DRAFT_477987 [Suillus ampliporus]
MNTPILTRTLSARCLHPRVFLFLSLHPYPTCFPCGVPHPLWLWLPGDSSLTFPCAELFLPSPIAVFPAALSRPSSLAVFPALSCHAYPRSPSLDNVCLCLFFSGFPFSGRFIVLHLCHISTCSCIALTFFHAGVCPFVTCLWSFIVMCHNRLNQSESWS